MALNVYKSFGNTISCRRSQYFASNALSNKSFSLLRLANIAYNAEFYSTAEIPKWKEHEKKSRKNLLEQREQQLKSTEKKHSSKFPSDLPDRWNKKDINPSEFSKTHSNWNKSGYGKNKFNSYDHLKNSQSDSADGNSNFSNYSSKQRTKTRSESSFNSQIKHPNIDASSAFHNTHQKSRDLIHIDEPDTFGLLSKEQIFTENYTNEQEAEDIKEQIFPKKFTDEQDTEDIKEQIFLENIPCRSQRLSIKEYANLIKHHIDNRRVKEALDVLEIRMLKEDRVKPDSYIYSLAIGACAKVGYTKKAFMLYNDMKRRALKVTWDIYTLLFDACANSPWRDDGLLRARHLRNLMLEKGIEPNLTNYNSMIKAFGRCGDLNTAFEIVDEMSRKKIKVRVHTFNFLLQSCITDKNSGFRHALLTWRKMLSKHEKPNIFSFNLMLRCIKECGFGSQKDASNILSDMISNSQMSINCKGDKRAYLLQSKALEIDSNHSPTLLSEQVNTAIELPIDQMNNAVKNSSTLSVDQMITCDKELHKIEDANQSLIGLFDPTNTDEKAISKTEVLSDTQLPNFLSRRPKIDGILGIGPIKTFEDRFLIAGGVEGFFEEMVSYDITPDIKTITQILTIQPSNLESEKKLLDILKISNIKPDINFFNVLMKKRCFRMDYEAAKGVRKLIQEENRARRKKRFWEFKPLVTPDIITYGVLALCCDTMDGAKELSAEMKKKNMRFNSEILGAMLRQATLKEDIEYITFIMETSESENVPLNKVFYSHLKKFQNKCLENLQEKNLSSVEETDKEKYTTYLQLSKKWLKKISKLQEEQPEHPWTQFRVNQPEVLHDFSEPMKKRFFKNPPRKIPKYQVKV